jgi:flagellar basal-body rod protein FlgC
MAIFQARNPRGRWPFQDRLKPQEPGKGVRVQAIMEDMAPFKMEYDPNHPDADSEGYVRRPNINIVHEMVDMITATRAYEANVTSINSAKDMINAALNIGSK